MKPLAAERVAKAEGDLRTAERELHAPEHPNDDAACFHAQQRAEKYLEARLSESDVSFPETHDLGGLLDLVLPLEPGWEDLRAELNARSASAVEVRDPGADAEDTRAATATARRVRERVRASLGLEG